MVTKRIRPLSGQRQDCPPCGHPAPLGLQGPCQERLPGQYSDPFRGRCKHPDTGIQIVPRQHREGIGGGHGTAIAGYHPPFRHHHSLASSARPGGGQAHRHLQMYRLQGLPGGVHGVERHSATPSEPTSASTTTRWILPRTRGR